MAGYLKLGDIKGESTEYKLDRAFIKSWSTSGDADDRPTDGDTFHFTDAPAEPAADNSHDNWIPILSVDQSISKPVSGSDSEVEWTYADRDDATSDPVPTEELTLGYTEVEWTY